MGSFHLPSLPLTCYLQFLGLGVPLCCQVVVLVTGTRAWWGTQQLSD